MTSTSRCRPSGKGVTPKGPLMEPLVCKVMSSSPSCKVKLCLESMTKVRLLYSWVRMRSTSHTCHLITHPLSQLPIWGLDSIQRQRLEEIIMGCREDPWKGYIHSHLVTLLRDLTLMSNSIRKMKNLQKWFYRKLSLENLMILINLRIHSKSTKQLRKCLYSEKSKENWSNLNLSRTRLSTSTCMGKTLWNLLAK